MKIGRSHRVQLRLPVQLDSVDHSRSFTGETIDLSRGGLGAQFRIEGPLPSIVWARIDATALGGGGIVFKAQRVWQGGLPGGVKRASYRFIRMQSRSRKQLEQLIALAVRRLVADLGDLPLFGGTDIHELEHLLTLARIREPDSGSLLCEAGRYDGAGVYLVLDGRVLLERNETTQMLGRGLAFGQWSDAGVQDHIASARAGESLRVLYLPAGFHAEVAVQAPGISQALRSALGGSSQAIAQRTARVLGRRIAR
jgi:CRP-like cAMP-binding protein